MKQQSGFEAELKDPILGPHSTSRQDLGLFIFTLINLLLHRRSSTPLGKICQPLQLLSYLTEILTPTSHPLGIHFPNSLLTSIFPVSTLQSSCFFFATLEKEGRRGGEESCYRWPSSSLPKMFRLKSRWHRPRKPWQCRAGIRCLQEGTMVSDVIWNFSQEPFMSAGAS